MCVSRILVIIVYVAVIMFTAEKVIVYVGTAKLIRDRHLIFYPKPIKYEFGYHNAALSLSFVNIESDVQLFEGGVHCCTPMHTNTQRALFLRCKFHGRSMG